MEVLFYQAECGDAARIRYKDKCGIYRNILIDSGYERTYKYIIEDEIKKIESLNERIDLWIISHIHDDHIGGAIAYINAIKRNEISDIVDEWYYNPPRISGKKLSSSIVSSASSVFQGDMLADFLVRIGKKIFPEITTELPTLDIHGLRITILSPTPKRLKALREKYSIKHRFERNELDEISYAKSVKGYDYSQRIEEFNLNEEAGDSSIENGSSISTLIEFNGLRTLWLADSHPSVIVDSLKRLGFSASNKIKCELVKVTHHGSKANNSNELYDLIECKNYLISANGENAHYLPDKQCLAHILQNKTRNRENTYHVHFTYDNATLRKIFEVDGKDIYASLNFEAHYLTNEKYITFSFSTD